MPADRDDSRGGIAAFAALALLIVLVGVVRVRLLGVPLERDEGEYAYAGRLILHGVSPYAGMYNMKLPGIYASYAALLALLGDSPVAVRVGLLLVNAAATIVLFHLARRFLDRGDALFAAAAFALLSLGPAVQGMFANAEHFVLLFALPGALLLLHALERRSTAALALAGVVLGCAFVVKQHAAFFVLFGVCAVVADTVSRRIAGEPEPLGAWIGRVLSFAGGALAVYAATCLVFLFAGAFGNFWHWTVTYAGAYVSEIPLASAPERFASATGEIVRSMPALWGAAGVGLALLLTGRWPGMRPLPLFLFAAFSLAAIVPGYYFRPHYYVLPLPAAAILAGGALSGFRRLLARRLSGRAAGTIALAVGLLCAGASIAAQRDFFFRLTPDQVCRRVFGMNPFVESPEIARFIEAHTKPEDRIAVIGSEPQIYFYANRRAATGYIYTYALMEEQPFALDMQREMIREIEQARPAMLVYVRNPHSWGYRGDSPTELLDWFDRYREAHYRLAGLVEQQTTHSDYHWEEPIPWPPKSDHYIAVLERTDRAATP